MSKKKLFIMMSILVVFVSVMISFADIGKDLEFTPKGGHSMGDWYETGSHYHSGPNQHCHIMRRDCWDCSHYEIRRVYVYCPGNGQDCPITAP